MFSLLEVERTDYILLYILYIIIYLYNYILTSLCIYTIPTGRNKAQLEVWLLLANCGEVFFWRKSYKRTVITVHH